MTRESIENLLDRVAAWPEEDQEKIARFIDEIEAKQRDVYKLTDQERQAVRRGLAEMRAGQLARDEEVAAVFNRYR
jgi:predicted transcriptional regulator